MESQTPSSKRALRKLQYWRAQGNPPTLRQPFLPTLCQPFANPLPTFSANPSPTPSFRKPPSGTRLETRTASWECPFPRFLLISGIFRVQGRKQTHHRTPACTKVRLKMLSDILFIKLSPPLLPLKPHTPKPAKTFSPLYRNV